MTTACFPPHTAGRRRRRRKKRPLTGCLSATEEPGPPRSFHRPHGLSTETWHGPVTILQSHGRQTTGSTKQPARCGAAKNVSAEERLEGARFSGVPELQRWFFHNRFHCTQDAHEKRNIENLKIKDVLLECCVSLIVHNQVRNGVYSHHLTEGAFPFYKEGIAIVRGVVGSTALRPSTDFRGKT